MFNKKIAALAVAALLAASLASSCVKDTQNDASESDIDQNVTQPETDETNQQPDSPDKAPGSTDETSDTSDENADPGFFVGKEPTDEVKQARADKIKTLSDDYVSKGYTVENVFDGVIKVTSPDGQVTQHGGDSILLDGAKHLPEPNFAYYVSSATQTGGELILKLEDISPAAISSYANKVQKDGYNREVMNSLSKDKSELYFHAEAEDGKSLDITARINHTVDIQLLYGE